MNSDQQEDTDIDLRSKTVFMSGGSRGIGLAIAQRLAQLVRRSGARGTARQCAAADRTAR